MFNKLFNALKKPFERRKHRRVPCHVKAHFIIIKNNYTHRGSAIITDITQHGFCCSKSSFFRFDEDMPLKVNMKMEIYFSLTRRDGTLHNFTVLGMMRSIMGEDTYGHTNRFGIQIVKINRKDKAILKECIAVLDENYASRTADDGNKH